MKAQILKREQTLNISIEKAWDFFSSPANLAEITLSWLDFRVMSDVPEKMYEGMIVQYNVHPFFHIPVWWVTEITHVREPFFFTDEQRKGPYAMWHHEHHFKETDKGVLMTDIVSYILPFDIIARPLLGGMIRNRLEAIFNYRFNVLAEKFTL